MRTLALGLAFSALLCGIADAQQRNLAPPQSRPDARQREALAQAAAPLLQRGYELPGQPGAGITGALSAGASWTHSIVFPPNRRVALVAVCDSNCTDLGMRLADPDGRLVARDTTSGARAVVEFTVSAPEFTLTIEMASCRRNPCRWAFTSLSRP